MIIRNLIFFSIFSFISLSALAQKYKPKDFPAQKYTSNYGKIIKIAPLPLFYGNIPLTGEYGFSVEQKAGLKTSFQGDIAYLGNGLLYLMILGSDTATQSSKQDRLTMVGFRAQAAYRFYFGKKYAPEGWYLAPHISYARCKISSVIGRQNNSYIQATHIDYSVILGHQFVRGRFAFDYYFGITYRQRYWAEKNNQNIKAWNSRDIESMYWITTPIRPKIGISFGRTY